MYLEFKEAVKEAKRQANETGEVRYVGVIRLANCDGFDVLKQESYNCIHNYRFEPEKGETERGGN